MPDQRHVYTAGHSVVVALSPGVREHLHLAPGQAVYWHLARGGEAVLSKRPVRVGGPPEGLALQKELDQARADILRLRRKLGARPTRLVGEGISHGWSMAMRAEHGIASVLDAILRELADIRLDLPRRHSKRAHRPSIPSPSAPPPSPVSSEGEAVTPGPSVPGDPQEHHEAERVPQP